MNRYAIHLPKEETELPRRGEKWFHKKQSRSKKKPKTYVLIGERYHQTYNWWIYLYDHYGQLINQRGLISYDDLMKRFIREQI